MCRRWGGVARPGTRQGTEGCVQGCPGIGWGTEWCVRWGDGSWPWVGHGGVCPVDGRGMEGCVRGQGRARSLGDVSDVHVA